MATLPKGIKHHYTCVSELGNYFPQERSEFVLLGTFPPYHDGRDISHAVAPG